MALRVEPLLNQYKLPMIKLYTYDKIVSMYKRQYIKNLNTNMLPQKVADVLDILKEQQFSTD